MRKQPTIERFWPKVCLWGNGCWLWLGSLSSNGYGFIWHEGRNVRAHRFAYEYFNNTSIPKGKEVDHLCRNHACVNPDHLDVVTRRENIMRGINPTILRQKPKSYWQRLGRLGGGHNRKIPPEEALKGADNGHIE